MCTVSYLNSPSFYIIKYDMDIANAKSVLEELDKYYPDSSKYEIAGFFWWQGDKDRYDESYATMYQRNLVRLIQQLRAEFDAPKSKFVLATLGQTDKDNAKGSEKMILDAMFGVDGNSGKYPDFVGNVATVYSHPLSKGGASNSHYNGNAETYMVSTAIFDCQSIQVFSPCFRSINANTSLTAFNSIEYWRSNGQGNGRNGVQ